MEYQKYVNEKKELYDILLKFIENEDDTYDNFQNLINIIQTQKIMNNRQDFELFIFLLMEISRNHHRHQQFIDKINQIFLQFGSNIKQTFSNIEIYNYIKNNKLILLFFIDMKIIQIDKQIADIILENEQKYFSFYFYPNILELIDRQKRSEIELELTEFDSNILDNFSEKRKVGENDSYICSLIRQDSVEDFVSFINRTNTSISKTKIKLSIFETNSFLIKKEPTLIEYSAFYGSIQIFNYLRFSKVELSPSLWIYAIHGRNAEIIHLLEENHVYPKDISYNECLKEAIKCHHNEIGQYIEDNLMNNLNFDEKVIKSIFHHCNYSYFPKDFNNKIVFYNLCNYNYLDLVNLYLKSKEKSSQNNVIKPKLEKAIEEDCIDMIYILLLDKVMNKQKKVFMGCKQLTHIVIPPSITSLKLSFFEGCTSLKHVVIPSSVTSIDDRAFYNCSLIEKIKIPSSVTQINEYAFFSCTSLKQILLPDSLISIGDGAFFRCSSLEVLKIPSSVNSIGNDCFSNCENLIHISIPSSITSLKSRTFNNCSSLMNISLPSSLKSIGDYCFFNCSSITTIDIPSSLNYIGEFCFSNCSNLIQISIPCSVNSINDATFNECTKLEKISIPSSVTSFGNSVFNNCSSLAQINLPPSTTSIGNSIFCGCTSLAHLSIPSSVTFIGNKAFFSCSSLVQIEILSSVAEIGDDAFYHCTSLEQISISSSIDSSKLGINPQVKVIKF